MYNKQLLLEVSFKYTSHHYDPEPNVTSTIINL